jgi:hypothetical protein
MKNKQDIINRIIESEMGIAMCAEVLEIMKDFAHYKNVDKRFLGALTEKGYWSFFVKDKYSSKLVIRKKIENPLYKFDGSNYVETSIYTSHCFSYTPITWQMIRDDFKRYAFDEDLKKYKAMLENSDEEIDRFKKFVEYVNTQSFTLFDLGEIKRKLRDGLEHLNKPTKEIA